MGEMKRAIARLRVDYLIVSCSSDNLHSQGLFASTIARYEPSQRDLTCHGFGFTRICFLVTAQFEKEPARSLPSLLRPG